MCHDCSHGSGTASEPERVMPFLLLLLLLRLLLLLSEWVVLNASGTNGNIRHRSMEGGKRGTGKIGAMKRSDKRRATIEMD